MTKCVSLMMVTYNRLELTKITIDNLTKTNDYPFRLIIIDNGSTDGTVEYLKSLTIDNKHFQGLHLHFNEINKGISIGRSQALLIAEQFKDDFLCTIDNDIELHYGWISECVNIIKTNHKFAVGVNFEGIDYPIQKMNGKEIQFKKAGNLGTACAMFHRKLFDNIGYFVNNYNTLYASEDAIFFFRARIAGWQMGYLPTNGKHLGVGDLDTGEYRAFKDECHKQNLHKFQKDCYDYMAGRKPIYISFEDSSITNSK